jgi:hypothetical protein
MINPFYKVAGYKTNVQKSFVFCVHKECAEEEIRKIMH